MGEASKSDARKETATGRSVAESVRARAPMTTFVESCVETVQDSAAAVERGTRHLPRARKLIRVLSKAKNILITAHQHPDPDALGSSFAMCHLLRSQLPGAQVQVSFKGAIGGGYNAALGQQSDNKPIPWDDGKLDGFDAIVLLDVQPAFKLNPLPAGVVPTAVIDHHRSRHRQPHCAFCDVRTDVGATTSIIFSYFMELDVPISPDLAAMMLFAIETDLAGAAGQPGELDNIALSSLTLLADTRKLYKMRYVPLPQAYFSSYASALNNAIYYETALFSHLDSIESAEQPAVIADFLLRFEQVQAVLVSAVRGGSLVLSLRTQAKAGSAADIMRKLLRDIGEGGGHRTKAGGSIALETGSSAEIDRIRARLRRRLLRALNISMSRGQRLVPKLSNGPRPG